MVLWGEYGVKKQYSVNTEISQFRAIDLAFKFANLEPHLGERYDRSTVLF